MDIVHTAFICLEACIAFVFAFRLWRASKYRLLGGTEGLASLGALMLGIQALSTLQSNIILSDVLLAAPLAILGVVAYAQPKADDTQKRPCILDEEGQRACHLAMLTEATGNDADVSRFREVVAKSRSQWAQAVKNRGMSDDDRH